jgi:hydroxyisourate hydrolase
MTLSTHVLDVDAGRPVGSLPVRAERWDEAAGAWLAVAAGTTDAEGRTGDLVPAAEWVSGRWRLVFEVGAYHGADAFWPQVTVEALVAEATHHHLPLLLARHGYTTYRGS